jgi:hypothetical protein
LSYWYSRVAVLSPDKTLEADIEIYDGVSKPQAKVYQFDMMMKITSDSMLF